MTKSWCYIYLLPRPTLSIGQHPTSTTPLQIITMITIQIVLTPLNISSPDIHLSKKTLQLLWNGATSESAYHLKCNQLWVFCLIDLFLYFIIVS